MAVVGLPSRLVYSLSLSCPFSFYRCRLSTSLAGAVVALFPGGGVAAFRPHSPRMLQLMDRLGELAGRLVDGVCCWRPRGLTFVPVAKSFTQVFQYPKGLGYAMDNAASLRAEAIPLWGGAIRGLLRWRNGPRVRTAWVGPEIALFRGGGWICSRQHPMGHIHVDGHELWQWWN